MGSRFYQEIQDKLKDHDVTNILDLDDIEGLIQYVVDLYCENMKEHLTPKVRTLKG